MLLNSCAKLIKKEEKGKNIHKIVYLCTINNARIE